MKNTKHYYLSVSEEEAKTISEMVAKLYGASCVYANANVDPEHGPVDPMADMLSSANPVLFKLHQALGDQYKKIQDTNAVVKGAKQDMVDDIVSALSSNATGLDLITKLISAIQDYEIIGRQPFRGDPNDNKDIPF